MQEEKKPNRIIVFALASLLTSSVLSAVLAVAGFLALLPYFVFLSAVLLTPFVNVFLYALYAGKNLDPTVRRAVTGIVSALGAYMFVCFMMGVVSGVYGAVPLEMEEMQEFEMGEYTGKLPAVFGNALAYFVSPGRLWQDVAARGERMWGLIAASAFFAQIGLPQLFIPARVKLPEPAGIAHQKKAVQKQKKR